MASKKNLRKKIEFLDSEEEDDNGFSDGDVVTDKVVSTFNYYTTPAAPAASSPTPAPAKGFNFFTASKTQNGLTDNRKIKTEANTATPRVEGEAYTIGRYYKLRYSTAKMLNEIKASNPDVNVYMNTLVDEAIRYYYSFGFKKL